MGIRRFDKLLLLHVAITEFQLRHTQCVSPVWLYSCIL